MRKYVKFIKVREVKNIFKQYVWIFYYLEVVQREMLKLFLREEIKTKVIVIEKKAILIEDEK